MLLIAQSAPIIIAKPGQCCQSFAALLSAAIWDLTWTSAHLRDRKGLPHLGTDASLPVVILVNIGGLCISRISMPTMALEEVVGSSDSGLFIPHEPLEEDEVLAKMPRKDKIYLHEHQVS